MCIAYSKRIHCHCGHSFEWFTSDVLFCAIEETSERTTAKYILLVEKRASQSLKQLIIDSISFNFINIKQSIANLI